MMARLNELPMSADNLETLRRRMLRQNRELAKSNNLRALRIRDLENECASMLSENLELRSRILDLEKQVEDSDARRIADHALAIKNKLESQLTEWATSLAELGLEPPTKRHSPRVRKPLRQRISFCTNRPSPSQRRLRDIAHDIEELGHISENKVYPRRSMNPEQIQALRTEADAADLFESPDLGPPPISKFIEEDPVKLDSPSRLDSDPLCTSSSHESASLQTKFPHYVDTNAADNPPVQKPPVLTTVEAVDMIMKTTLPFSLPGQNAVSQSKRVRSKRKLTNSDEMTAGLSGSGRNQEQAVSAKIEKSIYDKSKGSTQQSLGNKGGVSSVGGDTTTNTRRPLSAKSSNQGLGSPKKMYKTTAANAMVMDDIAAAKADLLRSKLSKERLKSKERTDRSSPLVRLPPAEVLPPVTTNLSSTTTESCLQSPNTPKCAVGNKTRGGDTPPPADISATGETSRPSRRSRAAVSYAEPNLRDKMRRPTKELCDAVTSKGKFVRRSSQAESTGFEGTKLKQDPSGEGDVRDTADRAPGTTSSEKLSDERNQKTKQNVSSRNSTSAAPVDKARKSSAAASGTTRSSEDGPADGVTNDTGQTSEASNTSGGGDFDIYEFTSSSPYSDQEVGEVMTQKGRRQTTSSKRFPTATAASEAEITSQDRNSSRRRSMML